MSCLGPGIVLPVGVPSKANSKLWNEFKNLLETHPTWHDITWNTIVQPGLSSFLTSTVIPCSPSIWQRIASEKTRMSGVSYHGESKKGYDRDSGWPYTFDTTPMARPPPSGPTSDGFRRPAVGRIMIYNGDGEDTDAG